MSIKHVLRCNLKTNDYSRLPGWPKATPHSRTVGNTILRQHQEQIARQTNNPSRTCNYPTIKNKTSIQSNDFVDRTTKQDQPSILSDILMDKAAKSEKSSTQS